jgi:peptidoglycan/xylan/chitin deacetylase (PgdA/CDA1 family)
MRATVKRVLAVPAGRRPGRGTTVLIYHRVGGGSPDERDLSVSDFRAQLDALARFDVMGLDVALDRLGADDDRPGVVLTFDDGFADVYHHAWPLLRERALPFTLYLASAFVGGTMEWEGSTARAAGPALAWDEVREMAASPLCTLGNHTHRHVRPADLTVAELDRCNEVIRRETRVTPRHFAYPWGIPVPRLEAELRRRFRSSATGELGRNTPTTDLARLRRVPVRRTDPLDFFTAKMTGRLGPERTYAHVVRLGKAAGVRA